jgi:hypothetical protein
MRAPWDKPWQVEEVDPAVVERLAIAHAPYREAVEMGVDIVSDPHAEDDDGYNWTVLSRARDVNDVTPGSTVVMGSVIGSYLLRGDFLGTKALVDGLQKPRGSTLWCP